MAWLNCTFLHANHLCVGSIIVDATITTHNGSVPSNGSDIHWTSLLDVLNDSFEGPFRCLDIAIGISCFIINHFSGNKTNSNNGRPPARNVTLGDGKKIPGTSQKNEYKFYFKIVNSHLPCEFADYNQVGRTQVAAKEMVDEMPERESSWEATNVLFLEPGTVLG
ncbi:uncharacterized protein [Elaeis guineensis]|uniref:uncharacterized protein n=1 Tax=Elaeis guineensis var. tenera TaxID=51953 RepID=UPI003C6D9E65